MAKSKLHVLRANFRFRLGAATRSMWPNRPLSIRLDPSTMTVFTAVFPKCFRSIARQRQMLGEYGDD